MEDKKRTKRELTSAYKQKPEEGGVFLIRNTITGKVLLDATPNLAGQRNRFEFAKATKSCIHKKLEKDWKEYGTDAFEFEVLEELKQTESQTSGEFAEDIKTLKEIWEEKTEETGRY